MAYVLTEFGIQDLEDNGHQGNVKNGNDNLIGDKVVGNVSSFSFPLFLVLVFQNGLCYEKQQQQNLQKFSS